MEDQLFYVGQKAFIEKGHEVLVLYDRDIGIDFPGGKIQIGEEDFEVSLKREIREETNLEVEVGQPFVVWSQIGTRAEHKGKKLFLVGFRCKYIFGQLKLSEEHDDFRWVSKTNYQDLDNKDQYFIYLQKYFAGT